jgi:hypothetical protein
MAENNIQNNMALISIASFVTQHLRLYYNFFDLYMNITKAYINGHQWVSINLSKWYSKLSVIISPLLSFLQLIRIWGFEQSGNEHAGLKYPRNTATLS